MDLSEILAQPEGFTPPVVTVKIKKVWPRKAGESANGPWSYQDIDVENGRLKLKNLPEFPTAREGQSVTLKANQSKQHGLTGMKVNHEQYNGNTYHKLVVTNSCKWEWAGSQNGTSSTASGSASTPPVTDIRAYLDHLLSCASVTNQVTNLLGITEQPAIQACFATICIDVKNRGIMLPKVLPELAVEKPEQGDPYDDVPVDEYEPEPNEFGPDDVPF